MQTIDEAVSNIRRAVYGKDVRESIASALEQAYQRSEERRVGKEC